jgi:2',3'-cyclic-nucleotide 2'-phosphodiesterase/3'-nucleotidase
MGRWRKIAQAVLTIMLVLSLAIAGRAACAKDTEPGTAIELTVLMVNDFHGALVEAGKNPGIAKLGQYIMEGTNKNPQGTLILSAGDMFQGSPDSNMLYGKTVVEAMNKIGFDAMVVGNHEFDWGLETLKRQIRQAKFPYLGANVIDKRTGKTAEFLKPYVILKKNGVDIAVIGLATPETAFKSTPKVVGDFIFADPVQTVRDLLPTVRKKAKVVIILSHLGCTIDQNTGEIGGEAADLAQGVQGIDLIITGHTHQNIVGKVNGIPVIQAGQYGRCVGKVNLVYTPAAKMVVSSVTSLTALPTPGLKADPGLAELLEKSQAEIGPVKNTIVGKTLWEMSHERSKVSLLGQWSTDVMREATKADIAFLNGGGLRTAIPAGNITVGKLYEVMPFDNTLYVVELSGEQVLQVLRHGINNPQIGMVQFSGIQVKYDEAMPKDERIIAVIMSDGTPLILNRFYKVVTNDFMAYGGDEYFTFKEGKNGFDTNISVRGIMTEAIKKQQILRFTGDNRFMDISKALEKAA